MVNNHAKKKQVREIAKAYSLSYTQAQTKLAWLNESNYSSKLSKEQLEIAKTASEILAAGENVFIFGQCGTGKTSLMHETLEQLKSSPRAYIGPDSSGLRSLDPAYRMFESGYSRIPAMNDVYSYNYVAFDELRNGLQWKISEIFNEKPLIRSIHAPTKETVFNRLSSLSNSNIRELPRTHFIKCEVEDTSIEYGQKRNRIAKFV